MKVDANLQGALAASGSMARSLEEHGYDGIWTSETAHDPFLPLVLAAASTSHADIGTAIAVAFARNPMNLAQLAWDLNAASEGRFTLGLGSQVKAHITRRFSMPWSQPAARMRELVLAVRSIWSSWANGTKLDFSGAFYTHTLMTPFFDPGPQEHGPPRIFLAGVGTRMTEVAGEVADGFLCHGFTTERYLREVTLPTLQAGAQMGGRSIADVEISLPALVVSATDEDGWSAAFDGTKQQIAFYASTPAYRAVLDLHGWGALHDDLHRLSKSGRWADMARLIDDDVLEAFAVVAPPDDLGPALERRFGGIVQRIAFYAPYPHDPDAWGVALRHLRATSRPREQTSYPASYQGESS